MSSDVDLGHLPHPRDRHDLVGQGDAEAAFAGALRSGRLHHAWLVGGLKGVGKATLAYRVARHLLAAPTERREVGLDTDPEGRTARQISAGSHPNLVVLERQAGEGDKAAPRTIPVEAVRRVLTFFASTAADGGHRICIVDSVEDLTTAGANALLKTIEEPPRRATILIVSHAPQRVLPTIRSRCRKLALRPLDAVQIEDIVHALEPAIGPADPSVLARAAAQADGSVSRALDLLDPRRLALIEEVAAILDTLPAPSPNAVMRVAERLAERRAEADFALALDVVLRWISQRVRDGRHLPPACLAPLADVCEKAVEAANDVEIYNLDRRPFVLSLFGDLAAALRVTA